VAKEDGVDGVEVYAASFGEQFSLPLPTTQGTFKTLERNGYAW